MITVSVLINGQPIMTRSATNRSETNEHGETKYLTDAGDVIWHKRGDGGKALAMKMLATIKEEWEK